MYVCMYACMYVHVCLYWLGSMLGFGLTLRVQSLPGVYPNPPFGRILDSTVYIRVYIYCRTGALARVGIWLGVAGWCIYITKYIYISIYLYCIYIYIYPLSLSAASDRLLEAGEQVGSGTATSERRGRREGRRAPWTYIYIYCRKGALFKVGVWLGVAGCCMHIYIYIHIYIHTYIYIHTHIHIYVYTYTYTYFCTGVLVHVDGVVDVWAQLDDIYTYIHIYMYTHTYIYICIYTHSYIYIYIHLYLRILLYRCAGAGGRYCRWLGAAGWYIHLYTYIYTHIHTYTYVYTCIHTYTYTYTYTYVYCCTGVLVRVHGIVDGWA